MSDALLVPPNSLEAEMALLGAVLVDRDMLDVVLDLIAPADFYSVTHETIYRAILALAAQQLPVDKITLAGYLRDRGQLDRVGNLPYLNSLLETVPTASSAEYYAQIVAEKAALRGLITFGTACQRIGFEGEADTAAALERAESLFTRTVDRATKRGGGQTLFEAMSANYSRLSGQQLGTVANVAQNTPFPTLNRHLGPLMPGAVCFWVGNAKMGKTATVLTLIEWLLQYGQVPLFSLEMTRDEIAQRYAAMHGRVSVRRQRDGDFNAAELDRIYAAGARFAGAPIDVFDTKSVSSLADVRRELRRIAKRGPIAAFVLDGVTFLDDLNTNIRTGQTETQQLDRTYKALRKMAQDFECVLHVTQHVRRKGTESGAPTMNDVRGGGNAEGIANAIIAPYRPMPNGKPEEQSQLEMHVLAAREGTATGAIEGFAFLGYRSLVLDPAHNGRAWFDPEPEPDQQTDIFAEAM